MRGPGRDRLVWLAALTAALAVSLWATSAFSAFAPKKPAEFVEGMKAYDAEDWARSADLLCEALKKQPEEDGSRVRLYGTKFYNYLPYYYLGVVLFRMDRCTDALEEWDRSTSRGVVKRYPQYQQLLSYQTECRRRPRSPAVYSCQ